jgi:hypothetical protein
MTAVTGAATLTLNTAATEWDTVCTLYPLQAPDAEEVLIAWLTPLRPGATAASRQAGDPLPFTLITHITGAEIVDSGTADLVLSVHTLCDRTLGFDAAKTEAQRTHRRILQLARHLDDNSQLTLNNGQQVGVDYIKITESPVWVPYQDTRIIRKVGRYTVGFSYAPAIST